MGAALVMSMNKKMEKKNGTSARYSKELADKICTLISGGTKAPLSLEEVCRFADIPTMATIYRWLSERTEFRDQYAMAREAQADWYADEIVSIADDTRDCPEDINSAKIRIDARKWKANKLSPRTYGDKQELDLKGSISFVDAVDYLRGNDNGNL